MHTESGRLMPCRADRLLRHLQIFDELGYGLVARYIIRGTKDG